MPGMKFAVIARPPVYGAPSPRSMVRRPTRYRASSGSSASTITPPPSGMRRWRRRRGRHEHLGRDPGMSSARDHLARWPEPSYESVVPRGARALGPIGGGRSEAGRRRTRVPPRRCDSARVLHPAPRARPHGAARGARVSPGGVRGLGPQPDPRRTPATASPNSAPRRSRPRECHALGRRVRSQIVSRFHPRGRASLPRRRRAGQSALDAGGRPAARFLAHGRCRAHRRPAGRARRGHRLAAPLLAAIDRLDVRFRSALPGRWRARDGHDRFALRHPQLQAKPDAPSPTRGLAGIGR